MEIWRKEDENQWVLSDNCCLCQLLTQDFPGRPYFKAHCSSFSNAAGPKKPQPDAEDMPVPFGRWRPSGQQLTEKVASPLLHRLWLAKMVSIWSRIILGVEAVDGDPYARFVSTSSLTNYVVRTFCSFYLSSKRRRRSPTEKKQGNCHGWEIETVLAVAKTSISSEEQR